MKKEIDRSGTIRYYNELEQLHRIDGPAIEYRTGTKFWYINGRYHRLDGPALEFIDGTKMWAQNGLRHRLDGPAVERNNGDTEYWIEGKSYSEDEYRLILFTQYGKVL